MTNYHWQAVSKAPSGPVTFKVGPRRKDGKYLVTMCYAKTLRKLLTAEQIQEYVECPESYHVIGFRQ